MPDVTDDKQAIRRESPDKGKLRVFISYGRDDQDFTDQLDAALDTYGYDCVIDRHSIAGGEDWRRRLGSLISEADMVVFVVSPTSARSETCAWEVEQATRLASASSPSSAGRWRMPGRRRSSKASTTSSSTPNPRHKAPASVRDCKA